MSKYFFYLRTLLVVAGFALLLMSAGVVFSQETSGNDSNSDNVGQPDRSVSKAERKSKRFETRKAQVLENIGKKRAILDTFESCVKSANSREGMKLCRTSNKSSMETLRNQRKEMQLKRKEMREKRRKPVN